MSTFSALNVFKSLSKAFAQQHGRQLSDTREQQSLAAGFSNYHELQSVGQRYPDDARLLRAAFGVEKFADVVFLPEVNKELAKQITQRAHLDDLAPKAPDCGFHAIRPPSPLSSGQAFHGHLATCSTAIRPGSRSAATQGLHC